MYAKIHIQCTLELLTGLHIGDSSGFAAIGALDNPVMRDAYTGDPMIPGSSLKGKMRTLLALSRRKARQTYLHNCADDPIEIGRLFGTPGTKTTNPRVARLQFSDAFISNRERMMKLGALTEVKTENAITRSTSLANPRPLERVIRGAEFAVEWFYSMDDASELMEDMRTFAEGLKLLSLDYLGGGGTRGNGRVKFSKFSVKCLLGELPVPEAEILGCFKDVDTYAARDL